MGFAALASTSSGHAWTIGRPDYAVTCDEMLSHLTLLCGAVDLPVNADFQSGFASDPEQVAANVRLALATGIAGLSIEDRKVRAMVSMRKRMRSNGSKRPGPRSTNPATKLFSLRVLKGFSAIPKHLRLQLTGWLPSPKPVRIAYTRRGYETNKISR